MNNRKRMIARVYRQNPTLSTRHRFERIGIAFIALVLLEIV